MTSSPSPVVLCILDGWGQRDAAPDNAISCANTPNWDRLMRDYPWMLLDASQTAVGLPKGQIGNSEVGHMSIGAGTRIKQDITRIGDMLDDGTFFASEAFTNLIAQNSTVHLIGLTSNGGVHASLGHQMALIRHLIKHNIRVNIHIITDGRDCPPQSIVDDLATSGLIGIGVTIATIGGRYYAMDRDNNWQRTQQASDAIIHAKGKRATNCMAAIEASYANDVFDEFIEPIVLGDYQGMQNNDCVIITNFRADRTKQFLQVLCNVDCPLDDHSIKLGDIAGFGSYGNNLTPYIQNLAPKQSLQNTLGECCANEGLRQLRIAETEKYAHVTFFFNGGREEPFAGENRILIPSPKVATYDLKPEMSARALSDDLIKAMDTHTHDLIIANYANADMVGHSGKLEPAIAAVECLDACLGRLLDAAIRNNARLLITADHGNIEQMQDAKSGQNHTAHTINPVPLVIVADGVEKTNRLHGSLCDIAPTIMTLLGLVKPASMSGSCVITQTS